MPPAEREALGSPLEGGIHIGKAPLGLFNLYQTLVDLTQASLGFGYILLW